MTPLSQRALKRIHEELKRFKESPPEFVPSIAISETNARTIYFIMEGFPQDSPYNRGQYIVELELHQNYPFEAPKIRMLTPSGRFTENTWICVAGLTHFHSEQWSPVLTFTTIMASFVSFFCDKTQGEIGGIATTDTLKKEYAASSREYNKKYATLFV